MTIQRSCSKMIGRLGSADVRLRVESESAADSDWMTSSDLAAVRFPLGKKLAGLWTAKVSLVPHTFTSVSIDRGVTVIRIVPWCVRLG